MNEQVEELTIKLPEAAFEGPLSLLLHLIEKNKMDIYDIKITEITEQYLSYLANWRQNKVEIAAEFLVMASTLLQVKSSLLLPRSTQEEADDDPRTDLVMQLVAYKRCKLLASDLIQRQSRYGGCLVRRPTSPTDLGIKLAKLPSPPLSMDKFMQACNKLVAKNAYRFQDIRKRVEYLLRQDKVPIKQKIKNFLNRIKASRRLFFFELVPFNAGKSELVAGFLAILELLRMNQILVTQKKSFDVILLEENPQADDQAWQEFLRDEGDHSYV